MKVYYFKMSKADLHVHTSSSPDALSSLREIFKKAKERKLDLVAITDHDTIKGAKEAQKIAPEFGIEAIVGQEITTKEGDLITLFIEEEIKAGRPAFDTVREIHKQGGLAIVPHPDNWICGGISFRILFKIFNELDGIELLNGSWFGWIKAQESKKLNSSTFNLAAIGGSDSHLAREVGCAYTIFDGKTAADLYSAIRAKKTLTGGTPWAYKDRFFWMLNFPRILYKWPTLPLATASHILKRIFL
jgi:hypothetical protein